VNLNDRVTINSTVVVYYAWSAWWLGVRYYRTELWWRSTI